jgi:hypothetical protein
MSLASSKDAAERRQHPRYETFWTATVRTAKGAFDCRVIDVSSEGAQLRIVSATVAAPAAANEKVMLTIPAIGRVLAVVAWARRNLIGLRIADTLALADWRAALERRAITPPLEPEGEGPQPPA